MTNSIPTAPALQSLSEDDAAFNTFAAVSTTGSWADSTHSVIWMTRGGMRHGLQGAQKASVKYGISLAVIMLLMLLAQANLIDVYGAPAQWVAAALLSTLFGALIALAGTQPALRLWWQIVLLVIAQFILGPIITLNSTTIAHIIPSLTTLSRGWEMTFGSFKYLIAIEPPIGVADGSLMAIWTIGLWLTFFASLFTLNINAWLSLLSALPLMAAMTVCALLGTHTGWHRAISGIVFAILLIVWLSWRLGLMEWGRWISASIILLLAAALAFAGTTAVPQNRMVLRDFYDPPISLMTTPVR
ncbi:transglutaminase-like superfamily protein [Bifidobacterium saguini DSM 23967]|uniref:Transglutaminase-like superfamily protein n=1 Tax=Bifidobacterium saguini DSM 23967 TaxID=1437607 RepID=A0A087DEM2_9BIFI|nr:transglutaminase-like superfamily protein [Bifidobacterium saguini DSM 23967]